MSRVLITGTTGFLGARITKDIKEKHQVLALKRNHSNMERWENVDIQPEWITMEGEWKENIIKWKPEVIIHGAWIGVEATERNQWELQLKNIAFQYELMDIAEKCKVRKFICLGSQAEYGFFSSPVDEQTEPIPTTAYGAVKIACCQLLRTFCEQQKIEWYWLRLFSFFGEGEGDNWLIPSIMKKMIKNEQVDLTEGLQRYAFLYAGDLHVVINKIMKCEGNEGIYNISSDKAITLRNLIERIKESLGSTSKLNFGAIPYRVNQPMLIQGDSRKFINEIGSFDITPFEEALGRTIVYYQHKFKSDTR